MEKLLARAMSEESIREVWEVPGDEFFLRHTSRQVAEVTRAIAGHENGSPLIVLLERKGQVSEEGATEICIYTRDRPKLFAATVGALSQLGLSVHDANIHTSEAGWCLNSFIVLDETGRPPGRGRSARQDLTDKLSQMLSDPDSDPSPIRRRLSRQLKQLPTPTEVTISAKPDGDAHVLTLIASDRAGLLASIGLVFSELGIEVLSARIATLGERVEDVFTIRDAGHPDKRPGSKERIYLLENAIRQRLDPQIAREL